MNDIFFSSALSPLEEIIHPLAAERGIRLYIKRDDLLHPVVTGNKWRKLKYNLLQAKADDVETVLSFGGAYSNHIHALSYAASACGLNSIGVIRGEPSSASNATLAYATSQGMQLHFVTREEYRQRKDADYLQQLSKKFGPCLIVPEGGSNALAIRGVAELVDEINSALPTSFDIICTACGTGGTLAGLIKGLLPGQQALGVAVLRQGGFINDFVKTQLPHVSRDSWRLLQEYHFGGYARFADELLDFIKNFQCCTGIPLEPVYTGKMMFALLDQIKQNHIPPGSAVVVLHTGGLQGLAGLQERFPELMKRIVV